MARGAAEPWTEPPAHPPAANSLAAAAPPDTLTIKDGDAEWTLAAEDVLFVAEPEARLTPIPHAPATVRGLACIEGRPFPVVDSAVDPAARRAGGALVVVASGDGGVALRVDAAGRKAGTAQRPANAASDILCGFAPWARPTAGRRPAFRPIPAAASIPLLFVACGEVVAAFPVTNPDAGQAIDAATGGGVTIKRVGTVSSRQPLRAQGVDALVRVDDLLLPARGLADALPIPPRGRSGETGERWAVVLGFDGRQAALLVDRVIGVTPCDPRQIIAVTLPGGVSQQWLDRSDMPPVPVVDAAALFGWPAAAPLPVAAASIAVADDAGAEPVLTVQAADTGLALPLSLIDRVLDPEVVPTAAPMPGAVPVFDAAVALGRRTRPRYGTLIVLRPEGAPPFVLSVDRTAAIAEPQSPWLSAEPLPGVAALVFDAVGRDDGADEQRKGRLEGQPEGEGGRWVYRLRCRLPPPSALPMPVRRCLAAARLGWVAADALPFGTAIPTHNRMLADHEH